MEHQELELNLINALERMQSVDFSQGFFEAENAIDLQLVNEQYFSVAIGKLKFVVKANCFCEVFYGLSVAAVPNSPKFLLGLSNVRGALVPVYQLHDTLKIPTPNKPYIFCIGKGDKMVGLLVNELPISLGLSQRDIVEDDSLAQYEVLDNLVKKTFFSARELKYLLDGESLGSELLVLANNEAVGTSSHSFNQSSSTYLL